MMTVDILKLKSVCERYSGSAPEYYIAPLPERKINNSRMSLNISLEEEVFALIDFTVFGSAKDAMVITEKGIVWKNIEDRTPVRLSWAQLEEYTPSEQQGALSKSIVFNDNLKMSLSGASKFIAKDNHAVLELLNDLKLLSADKCIENQSNEPVIDADDGLIICEFCKGKIKPDVTYCKHCGIKLRG